MPVIVMCFGMQLAVLIYWTSGGFYCGICGMLRNELIFGFSTIVFSTFLLSQKSHKCMGIGTCRMTMMYPKCFSKISSRNLFTANDRHILLF